MTDPTPIDARAEHLAALKAKQASREQGIHANAFKQGRIAERTEIQTQLGVQAIADASQCAQLREERDARPTANEELKHGRHQRSAGRFEGALVGLALGTVLAYVLMPVVTTAVSGLLHEATITGAMVSSQQERAPTLPRQ